MSKSFYLDANSKSFRKFEDCYKIVQNMNDNTWRTMSLQQQDFEDSQHDRSQELEDQRFEEMGDNQ